MDRQKKAVKRTLRAAQGKAPVERPDWLRQTPHVLYALDAFCMNGEGDVQRVGVNKDEYDALKMYLATLRGIQPPQGKPHARVAPWRE